jgi:hypothetical protein
LDIGEKALEVWLRRDTYRVLKKEREMGDGYMIGFFGG